MIVRATVDPGAFNQAATLPVRAPTEFREVYVQTVVPDDFRRNPRGELGTRTVTLHKDGLIKLRANWVYLLSPK